MTRQETRREMVERRKAKRTEERKRTKGTGFHVVAFCFFVFMVILTFTSLTKLVEAKEEQRRTGWQQMEAQVDALEKIAEELRKIRLELEKR